MSLQNLVPNRAHPRIKVGLKTSHFMHSEHSLAAYQRKPAASSLYRDGVDTQYMQKPPQSTSLYTFIGTQPSSLNIVFFFSLLMSSNISLIDKTTSTLTDGSISIDHRMPLRAASLVIQLAED